MSQLDMSEPAPVEPSREHVEQWVQNVSYELQRAYEVGVFVPETVAVYADPQLIAAAVRMSQQTMRVQFAAGQTPVLLAPPPPSYTLGTIAEEIERACAEATPTEPPKATPVQLDGAVYP